jgi:hypothetical protein
MMALLGTTLGMAVSQVIWLGYAPPAPEPKDRVITTEEVRKLVRIPDQVTRGILAVYGSVAFPAYEAILGDPASTPEEIGGVLGAISRAQVSKARKSRFHDLAVPYLAHKDSAVRQTAAALMREIGKPEDGSILVALLPDEFESVACLAAEALAKTGGRREVVAMDAWLRGAANRYDADFLEYVKKCRDELEKRLKDNPIPKDLKN